MQSVWYLVGFVQGKCWSKEKDDSLATFQQTWKVTNQYTTLIWFLNVLAKKTKYLGGCHWFRYYLKLFHFSYYKNFKWLVQLVRVVKLHNTNMKCDNVFAVNGIPNQLRTDQLKKMWCIVRQLVPICSHFSKTQKSLIASFMPPW